MTDRNDPLQIISDALTEAFSAGFLMGFVLREPGTAVSEDVVQNTLDSQGEATTLYVAHCLKRLMTQLREAGCVNV